MHGRVHGRAGEGECGMGRCGGQERVEGGGAASAPAAGALLAQDTIAEWLDRYHLELNSESEQVMYQLILETLERAELHELK